MPRRMIEPDIWRNERIGSLPDAGRLLFIGIFSSADDDGRLKASPKYLKAIIFPYDNDKTEDLIRELRDLCSQLGLIRLYSQNGCEYLDIPGWREHQRIRKDRYNPSSLPGFEDCGNQTVTTAQPNSNQVATTGRHSIVKYSLVKSSIYTPIAPKGGNHKNSVDARELFDLWNSLGVTRHRKLTGDMTRALAAASRDFSAAEISQAIKNYAHIVNDERCYFKYRWTFKDFLKRGLEKFLDLEVALNNYRKGGDDGFDKKRASPSGPLSGKPTPFDPSKPLR
ncbi:MAG: hypothetical protein PHI12_14755 [Dehalococcoidales bacterium]|nr:hypothetical protein [Dehalococcoidales bacterium]